MAQTRNRIFTFLSSSAISWRSFGNNTNKAVRPWLIFDLSPTMFNSDILATPHRLAKLFDEIGLASRLTAALLEPEIEKYSNDL